MSTRSMQQSSRNIIQIAVAAQAEDPADMAGSARRMADFLDLRPEDRVLVLGRHSADRLVALSRCGCRSAMSLDPAFLRSLSEPADVVWINSVGELDASLAALIGRIDGVRLVAVELAAASALEPLQSFLRQLRRMGLALQSFSRLDGRIVVTSQRAEWLKWIA